MWKTAGKKLILTDTGVKSGIKLNRITSQRYLLLQRIRPRQVGHKLSFFPPGTFLEKNFISMRRFLERFRASTSNLCFKLLPHRSCQVSYLCIYLSWILGFWGRSLKLSLNSFPQNSDVKGWCQLLRLYWLIGLWGDFPQEWSSFHVSTNHSMCIRTFFLVTNELMSQRNLQKL